MDSRLRETILELLRERDSGKTICPSEAARAAYPGNWREHMDDIRAAAVELAREDLVEICQGGKAVDPGDFKGAIRLRSRS